MHRGRAVRLGVVVAIATTLGIAACGGSADDDPVVAASVADDATAGAPAARLLDVDEFAPLLEEPGVTVINVHVPYEGELPDTDAFVPYDRIVGADALPDDRDAPIALYCRSGSMSAEASSALLEAGHTDVRDLDGGMIAWEESGRDLIMADR